MGLVLLRAPISLQLAAHRLFHNRPNDRGQDFGEGVVPIGHLRCFDRLRSALTFPPFDPDLWTHAQSRVANGLLSWPG